MQSQDNKNKPPLVILLGPTAVGKTAVSIKLAKKLGAEIVSADSRLFYRGMNIGTAKPTIEEMEGIAHHLIDIANPDETINLAQYLKLAHSAIKEIHSRGNIPLMVGGTGQYIRAIVNGWKVPEVSPNQILRECLTQWGNDIGREELHMRLRSIDADAANNMDARNLQRVVRAFEVIFITGVKFSEQRKVKENPYKVLQLGLTMARQELFTRIDERIESMLLSGFINEVKTLLDSGYSPRLPSFSAIGYRQISDLIANDLIEAEVIVEIKRATRIFVRRQSNWFKPDDQNIKWFSTNGDIVQQMAELIRINLSE